MRLDFVMHGIRRQIQLTRPRNSAGLHAHPAEEIWILQDLENTGQMSGFKLDAAGHPSAKRTCKVNRQGLVFAPSAITQRTPASMPPDLYRH